MVLHDTFPQTYLLPAFAAAARFAACHCEQTFVKTPSTHRTFHRTVPPPFLLEIELLGCPLEILLFIRSY